MKDVFTVKRSADGDDVLKQLNGQYKKVITAAWTTNNYTVEDADTGSIIVLPTTGDNSTVTLPSYDVGLTYKFTVSAQSGAHTIIFAGTFVGVGTDAGVVMPMSGTALTVAASDWHVGDVLELTCISATQWLAEAHFVTADAITVS